MQSRLRDIARNIGSLIEDRDARLSVVVQTGYDEAGLVGTRDAYLRLAKVLVEFLAAAQENQADTWAIAGTERSGTAMVGEVFDGACEIGLDSAYLTASDTDTRTVVDYFLRASPPHTGA